MNKISTESLALSYRQGIFTTNEVYSYLMYNNYKVEDLSSYLSDKEFNELQEKINIIENEIKQSILSGNLEDIVFSSGCGFQFTIPANHYIT